MSSDELTPEFILAEVKKLQYLYGLKREIRYACTRAEEIESESVAEHIYGMFICAKYFLPLEDKNQQWDQAKIFSMIAFHDLDEIETGDVLGYTKTDAMRAEETAALKKVAQNAPHIMQADILSTVGEYEARQTIEAQFVRAIDKFEPLIQIYNESGKKILALNKTTEENSSSIKSPYIAPFKIMNQYYKVIHSQMITEGYFYTSE